MKFFVYFLLLIATAARAEDSLQISVAAHSLSGSYEKMLGELIGTCSDDKFEIKQAQGITGGTVGNLQALVDNKAQAAFVRSDVFTAISQADSSYKRFQTLVTLYPEPVHILVLRKSKTKKKGTLEFGNVEFNSLADINGYPVGGGGGTVYTLKILKGMGGGKFDIASFDKSDDMIAALDKGEIAAAAFVGAAPLPNLMKLDKNKYKLIPIGESIANSLKGIYKPMSLNYAGLSDGPVYTVSSLLVIMTRKFSTPQKIAAQRHFRQCFYKSLNTLKDDASPSWQLVDPNDRGVLDWYDIPDGK